MNEARILFCMIHFVGRRNRENCKALGYFVTIFGLVFLGIGLFLLKDVLSFMPGTITAQGTIIHCSYDESSDNASNCSPTVRFTTQSGQSITIGSADSCSSLYEGKEVQVRYNPETPHEIRIDSFRNVRKS